MEDTKIINSALERQVERGSLFTHTALSKQSARINEIESFLYAVIDILAQKGITPPEELKLAVEGVRDEMMEKGEMAHPGLSLRVDGEEDSAFIPVNCNERMHICEAVCCKLQFALSAEEIEAGKVRWDLGRPYTIRQEQNCYCTHINPEDKKCNVYNDRPSVCKKYSCANDTRIWNDFDKMVLNKTWIEENIQENRFQFHRAPMFTDEQVVNTYSS
jgi:Fe-S-cluster containining protein